MDDSYIPVNIVHIDSCLNVDDDDVLTLVVNDDNIVVGVILPDDFSVPDDNTVDDTVSS